MNKKNIKDKLGARAFLRLKDLEETRSFYQVELKKEDLTEIKRDKYLRALKLIEGFIFIEKEKKPRDQGYKKNNYLNSRGGLDLVDKFPGIDFMNYEKERLRRQKAKR